jgi:hypothetical protein
MRTLRKHAPVTRPLSRDCRSGKFELGLLPRTVATMHRSHVVDISWYGSKCMERVLQK